MPAAGETIRVPIMWEEAARMHSPGYYWFTGADILPKYGDVPDWTNVFVDVPPRRNIEFNGNVDLNAGNPFLRGAMWVRCTFTIYANRW